MRSIVLFPALLLVFLAPAQSTWNPEPYITDEAITFRDDLDFYLNSYTKPQIKEMRKQVNILKMSFNKVMKNQIKEIRSFSEGNLNDGKTKDFTLATTEGEEFTLSDHGGKVRAFMFASITNPPAMHQLPKWTKLAEKYDTSQVVLFVIYGRELHPGEKHFRKYKWPKSEGEKLALAQELAEKTTLPVLVDGMNEAVQKKYGTVPNAAFVIDDEGRQVFRATWADATKVEHIVDTLLDRAPANN